jgi:RNA binding exosome subunit
MNRSSFPSAVDSFVEHYDIQAQHKPMVDRYQELLLKPVLSESEQTEFDTLSVSLSSLIFSAEDLNKIQDCMVALETFFKDNVEGYIETKQGEFETYVGDKETEVNTSCSNAVTEMTNKKNLFTTYVDTKEDEVRAMVQEFDSNTARYYQTWSASEGQVDFNIYSGNSGEVIPVEGNLNIPPENIDVIVNGTALTPKVDYIVLNNGLSDTIRLLGNASTVIMNGTSVFAKWYKNVGKLYFLYANSHAEGGSDEITVTRSLLADDLKQAVPEVSAEEPLSPMTNQLWVDIS